MQRLFGLVGLLVLLASSEAVSELALKTVLVLYGERGDLPAVRAIEENRREVFHPSTSPRVELYPEYCGLASLPLCSRTICFSLLRR
jgi:hypothetical protein